jgi:hypothetical protein
VRLAKAVGHDITIHFSMNTVQITPEGEKRVRAIKQKLENELYELAITLSYGVALKYFKQEIVNETVPEEKTKMYNLLTLESPNRRLRRSRKV